MACGAGTPALMAASSQRRNKVTGSSGAACGSKPGISSGNTRWDQSISRMPASSAVISLLYLKGGSKLPVKLLEVRPLVYLRGERIHVGQHARQPGDRVPDVPVEIKFLSDALQM